MVWPQSADQGCAGRPDSRFGLSAGAVGSTDRPAGL